MQRVPTDDTEPRISRARARGIRIAAISAGALLGAFLIVAVVLVFKWPFTKSDFLRDLKHFSASDVRVTHFRQSYFPHPGYIAEGVTFARRSGQSWIEMAQVKRIECIGSWMALFTFTHRVPDLNIQGLHVSIPAKVPPAMPFYPDLKDQTTISMLRADGSILEVAPREPDTQKLRLEFEKLLLGEVKKEKAISLQTLVKLPESQGELAVTGTVGPFQKSRLPEMPVSGSFQLRQLGLEQVEGISGAVEGRGSFAGTLGRCKVQGKVQLNDFQLKKIRHAMKLDGEFDTTVDGLHGDITIHSTKVSFLQSELNAKGDIRSTQGGDGKTTSLEVTTVHTEVEDLLRLFVNSDPPALRGPIQFRANVVLPPGPQEFLKKVRLVGDFKIPSAEFPKLSTEANVEKLSRRARGKKTKKDAPKQENIAASMSAHVDLRNGTADLSQATFQVPGASAAGGGTYSLLTSAIDLRSEVAIQASLSKAAGGIKSVLLLPLDPFFKTEHAGAVLPVRITGTYSHPAFHVSLRKPKG
jgi:AsmA-like C-terminal region